MIRTSKVMVFVLKYVSAVPTSFSSSLTQDQAQRSLCRINRQTRELISARKTLHKHNKDLNRLQKLSLRKRICKVHKLHHGYIFKIGIIIIIPSVSGTHDSVMTQNKTKNHFAFKTGHSPLNPLIIVF